jgi:hypothetical protein
MNWRYVSSNAAALIVIAPLLPVISTAAGAFRLLSTQEPTIADIRAAIESKDVTCRQLVQMYLDRIEAYDKKGPSLNAIIVVNPRALASADLLDTDWRLGPRVRRGSAFRGQRNAFWWWRSPIRWWGGPVRGPTQLWPGCARLWRYYGGRSYYYGGRRFGYGLGALGLLGAGLAYNYTSCYVWTPYGYVNECGYTYSYGWY